MPQLGEPLDHSFLNELLQPICGQPLTQMYRAVGQVFEFGLQEPATNRRGDAITRGDFLFKFIWADWRIVHRGRIVLGSSDYDDKTWFYNTEDPHIQPYDADARTLAHEFLGNVAGGKFMAESVEVGEFADVKIQFSDGLMIQSFGSSAQDHDLWWYHNQRTNVSCLVGTAGHTVGPSESI